MKSEEEGCCVDESTELGLVFVCVLQTQARCYQLLLSVFQHSCRSLSTPYIHSLAPLLVEKLKAVEHSRPSTPAELQAVQEGVKVLESLVAMGEEQNRKCLVGPIILAVNPMKLLYQI